MSWFILEKRLNGQCRQPGWIQFRHDKYSIERWRENLYKDNNTLKTNITNNTCINKTLVSVIQYSIVLLEWYNFSSQCSRDWINLVARICLELQVMNVCKTRLHMMWELLHLNEAAQECFKMQILGIKLLSPKCISWYSKTNKFIIFDNTEQHLKSSQTFNFH